MLQNFDMECWYEIVSRLRWKVLSHSESNIVVETEPGRHIRFNRGGSFSRLDIPSPAENTLISLWEQMKKRGDIDAQEF